jgi:hypothetical protein
MRDLSATDPLIDDIDALIDEAVADPSRADVVKTRVRHRLARRLAVPLPHAVEELQGEDAEDLWDNLPL